MSDDVLVRVENVSKRFCRSLKRSLWTGLQDLASEIGGRCHRRGATCRRPAWRNYDELTKGLQRMQGDGLEDLKAQLLDLYHEFAKEDLPGIRKIGELVVA